MYRWYKLKGGILDNVEFYGCKIFNSVLSDKLFRFTGSIEFPTKVGYAIAKSILMHHLHWSKKFSQIVQFDNMKKFAP
jgi:hypothetical protein